MTTSTTSTLERTGRPSGVGWPVGVALIVLSIIPLSAGVLRLVQLAGGPPLIPADDRFAGLPVALVVHIAGSGCFALLGVLQLLERFRRHHRTWHRRAGRGMVVAGLAVVGSALWLNLGYPSHPGTGPALFVSRLAVSAAMGTFLVLGLAAVRRSDITAHRAWMIRAYALALGAGTQAFTEGFTETLVGSGELSGDLAKLGGWVINLAVAEWAIRCTPRTAAAGGRTSTVTVSPLPPEDHLRTSTVTPGEAVGLRPLGRRDRDDPVEVARHRHAPHLARGADDRCAEHRGLLEHADADPEQA